MGYCCASVRCLVEVTEARGGRHNTRASMLQRQALAITEAHDPKLEHGVVLKSSFYFCPVVVAWHDGSYLFALLKSRLVVDDFSAQSATIDRIPLFK